MVSRRTSAPSNQSPVATVTVNDVLIAQLEASKARIEILELQRKVDILEGVIREQTITIKENTALLRKQRPLPRRPYMNHTAKAILAARQGFKCANPDNSCPLFKTGDGVYNEALYEVDHIIPYHVSGLHHGNLHVLCPFCHARRTRLQIAERNQHESDSDDADDGC